MVMLNIFLHNYFRETEIYLFNNRETNRGKIWITYLSCKCWEKFTHTIFFVWWYNHTHNKFTTL